MCLNKKELLDRCKRKLEEQVKWGSNSNWSNHEFEDLSERMSEITGVKLSITTFKRICGKVKYEGTFTKSTLNALANFIGFENWSYFVAQNSVTDVPLANQNTSTPPTAPITRI